jgi:formylglycine-generating enzyme required for sulfatase activity
LRGIPLLVLSFLFLFSQGTFAQIHSQSHSQNNTQNPVQLNWIPLSCKEVLLKTKAPIHDIKSFGESMTQGMLLNPEQSDLFELYRGLFFGDPRTPIDAANLNTVTEYLEVFPELTKEPFREYEISSVEKKYEIPESLNKYLKSQFQTSGQVRSNLFQIESNLGYWKKILDYHEIEISSSLSKEDQKAAQRLAKEEFEAFLNRVISKYNRDLLSDLKLDHIDYLEKTKALYMTLKEMLKWMTKKGYQTQHLRQAIVDLIQYVGFGNQATVALLKSSNGLDRIEGLKKLINERDSLALDLGYRGMFEELMFHMNIEFPTGFSKNETPEGVIEKIEKEVLSGPVSYVSKETVRVRSLSIQESPFRSCLGGDCSSRFYFSKALDPNFYYFTLTDSDHRSSGHVTVVLGSATDSQSQKKVKVAFLDKMQNIPLQQIPEFLNAVAMALKEKGFQLALPMEVGDHNGISNMPTISDYLRTEIIPALNHKLLTFEVDDKKYKFKNVYSRAYNFLNLLVYDLRKLETDTVIQLGRHYETTRADRKLDKSTLLDEFFKLRESENQKDLFKYVTSEKLVQQLDQLGLYSMPEFLKDIEQIGQRENMSFNLRKQIMMTLLIREANKKSDWPIRKILIPLNDSEKTQMASEIHQWSKSSDQRKNRAIQEINYVWRMAFVKGDYKTIENFIDLKLFDLNKRNESGFSPLLYALYHRNENLIKWFLNQPDIDLESKNKFGMNDLEWAVHSGLGDLPILKKYESKIANFNNPPQERNADGSPIIEFVKIPAGSFKMGTSVLRGTTWAPVTITRDFEVLSVKTTRKMWADLIKLSAKHLKGSLTLNPTPFQSSFQNLVALTKKFISKYQVKGNNYDFSSDGIPIDHISFEEVQSWLTTANILSNLEVPEVQDALKAIFPDHEMGYIYRLPTEAEAMFVTTNRGLSLTWFSQGHSDWLAYSWLAFNSKDEIHPVGQKRPLMINGHPIYDVQGNTIDWVSDWYHDRLRGGVNPQGPEGGKAHVKLGAGFGDSPGTVTRRERFLFIEPSDISKSSPERFEGLGFRILREKPLP